MMVSPQLRAPTPQPATTQMWVLMASSAGLEAAASPVSQDQVLLVEDDDGDALLVEDRRSKVGSPVVVQRARSLSQAKPLVPGAACGLLGRGHQGFGLAER